MITRSEYLNAPPEDRARMHRLYYGQLVTPRTVEYVVSKIGADAIMASTCPHFNDIPLQRWDGLTRFLPHGDFKELGDYATLGGLVCVAKEAAQQYREAHQNSDSASSQL